MRRLPHQGARHGTVDHGDAFDGVLLLLHLWVLPSNWAILLPNDLLPLSLACGWALGANGSVSCEWRRLHELWVEGSSGARKGGRTNPRSGPIRPAWADRPRPISAQFGLPFAPVVLMYLCTLLPPLAICWQCHPRVQDGGSPCMKSGLLRFNPRGCSFVTLQSLPPLEVISSSS
jgi:hypothetical protein